MSDKRNYRGPTGTPLPGTFSRPLSPPPDHAQPTPRRGDDVEVPTCPRGHPLNECRCTDNNLRK